ncbi:hypothetical protein ACFWBR_42470 [Streptomyces sp. NPDC060006]|uniref:hypothetical protein n=1 Tax=unclassified Streptomyces TaxID=2593676 RepID=UPI0036995E3E
MTREELQERARQQVAEWPPVSDETYAQLALLLAPEPLAVARPVAARPQPTAA